MLRSIACALFCLSVVACARTSDNPPVVTAPVASGTAAAASASTGSASPVPAASASAGAGGDTMGGDDDADAGAPQFRACQADSDCVAVPRVGCCHNGWMAAINASQKDAYAQSFTCPQARPICPMYITRDTRVARCSASHLCAMVRVQP